MAHNNSLSNLDLFTKARVTCMLFHRQLKMGFLHHFVPRLMTL